MASVMMSVAMQETTNDTELRHLFAKIDANSLGCGSMVHIYSMFLGVVGFMMGCLAMAYKYFPREGNHNTNSLTSTSTLILSATLVLT